MGIALLAAALAAGLWLLPAPAVRPLKGAARRLVTPVQSVLIRGAARVREGWRTVRGMGGLVERYQQLSEEIVELQTDLRAMETLERENRELREQLAFFRSTGRPMIACEVVGRGISGWWRTLRLNRGSRDGVRPGRAVVSPDGLVGSTAEVNAMSCEVRLLSDPSSWISARLVRAGSYGVVKGRGSEGGRPTCRIEFINKDVEVRRGDTVVTSGLGGIYPEGLVIGYVEEVRTDRSGLYQSAGVVPKADLGRLRFAFVLGAKKPPSPEPLQGGAP
ncbi:Rod shape-determining protein MreC [Kiritimatiella glycovorans]|uniref:Cell shape-determining protein MreC n=2 Tax=Kiritimatiella glycovorans TaxID=1307763 RepID=A0A0G3EJA1_9BACT|nr:Rod shape-determining protein MreC [Kiritimatiella glycovorans]